MNYNNEVWKDIEGYEGHYQVSSFGRIKSLKNMTEKILKFNKNRKGYYSVQLSIDGVAKRIEIHRIVGLTFISKECQCFNHLDGDKTNNKVENLQPSSFSENINHAVDILNAHVRALQVVIKNTYNEEIKVFGSMSKASLYLNKSNGWLKWKRKTEKKDKIIYNRDIGEIR